jgi:hypothetical protein
VQSWGEAGVKVCDQPGIMLGSLTKNTDRYKTVFSLGFLADPLKMHVSL